MRTNFIVLTNITLVLIAVIKPINDINCAQYDATYERNSNFICFFFEKKFSKIASRNDYYH